VVERCAADRELWLSDPHVLATWVNEIDGYFGVSAEAFDPPELASGVKKIAGCLVPVANNLFHRPGKLAGVESGRYRSATKRPRP
jgi:hypothetical protein